MVDPPPPELRRELPPPDPRDALLPEPRELLPELGLLAELRLAALLKLLRLLLLKLRLPPLLLRAEEKLEPPIRPPLRAAHALPLRGESTCTYAWRG